MAILLSSCIDEISNILKSTYNINHLPTLPHILLNLMATSDQAAGDFASSLGIAVDLHDASAATSDGNDRKVQKRLIREVKHLALLIGTLEGFLAAEDQSGVLKCITEGLNILFDIKYPLFFLMDETRNALIGYLPDKAGQYGRHPALSVSMRMEGSLLVRPTA